MAAPQGTAFAAVEPPRGPYGVRYAVVRERGTMSNRVKPVGPVE
ncbi:hypothetical protein [Nonomuraea longispora]|nr:hypothetical protein [Nonomuraea longispora]